jgi:Ca2+-binding EF-hand superfamily protein
VEDNGATRVFPVLFIILFTIELALRWIADGFWQFFQSGDIYWNLMDIIVVASGIIDIMLDAMIDADSTAGFTRNVAVLRILRIVRIVRIARVIRVMRFFRELRIMIFSILGSLKSLLWVIMVLGFMFYMFAVGFVAATTNYIHDDFDPAVWGETNEGALLLQSHFGTIDSALLSFFMAMSGGNDWGVYYDTISILGMPYRMAFLLYISFALFAVVNVVTGVFVDSAMQCNHTDREVVVHEELQSKKMYLERMAEIFMEMDADGTGCISMQEFENRLQDERVIAYFSAMKLDVSDARMLFSLLDHDHSEEVEIKEFLAGCYKLQGESRSLDMKIMQYEVRFLAEMLSEIHEGLVGAETRM